MLLWRGAAAFRACIPRFSGQFSSRTPFSRALGANQLQLPAPQRCTALPRLVFCQARRKAAAPDVPAPKVYKLPVHPHPRIHETDECPASTPSIAPQRRMAGGDLFAVYLLVSLKQRASGGKVGVTYIG